MKKTRVYGLILAAGFSSRMGAYKPLLCYKGKSFIQNVIKKLNYVCEKIIVVTGFRPQDIEKNVNDLNNAEISSEIEFIFNEDFETGMFSSLQKGSGACSEADWVLYHFVDQPSLPKEYYIEFINQINEKYDWIQPVIDRRKGHPILFNNTIIKKIISFHLDSNLKEISQSIENKKYWYCNYKQIFDDIDNIDDYKNLCK